MVKFKPGDLVVPVETYGGTPHLLIETGFVLGEVSERACVFGGLLSVYVTTVLPNTTGWTVGSCLELSADRFRKL